MLPILYEMPKIITKYINIYLKIDSIVTRFLIAPGLDHAEGAICFRGCKSSLVYQKYVTQRHGRWSRTLITTRPRRREPLCLPYIWTLATRLENVVADREGSSDEVLAYYRECSMTTQTCALIRIWDGDTDTSHDISTGGMSPSIWGVKAVTYRDFSSMQHFLDRFLPAR